MQEHLKNIRAELAAAQHVAESKAREVKTEEHLGAMAERAAGRSRQELAALSGKAEETRSLLTGVQAALLKGSERLEAFKASMNWKQEALEKWAAAAKQREEDGLVLQR
jgi:hypothetical protein